MNRIYQGKVTAVEISDGKDDSGNLKWKPFDSDAKKNREKWQYVLWKHHEMFQDNVNYLLAAFAAQVPADCGDDVWMDYRAAIERSWKSYTGRQGSWARPFETACLIVGCAKDASFKEFQRKLSGLTGSKASEKQRLEALKQLFESATEAVKKLKDPDQPVEDSLKGKGKDLFGDTLVNLCAQKTKVTPRDVKAKQRDHASECTKKVNEGGHLKWASVFYFKTDVSEGAWSREDAAKNIIQCLDKLVAELQQKTKNAKTNDQKKKLSELAGRLEKQKKPLAAWCNNPKTDLPTNEPTRKGSGGYDLKAAILFSVRPDLDGLRDAFLLFNQARLKEEPLTTASVDAAYAARMAGGAARRVFPFFCDLWADRLNDDKVGQGVWPDFEKQAFIEVFTKIGQFILRERKFELRLAVANQAIARIKKQKETDARLQAVEGIAVELANRAADAGARVDEHGKPRPYSIRERTMKAWPKVRAAWRDTVTKTPNVTAEDLVKQKNRLQERQREKFGSADLFDFLAKERDVWNHADEDPLKIWADYVEALEEKTHLEAERLFAPAHAIYSPRFFRWSETNNKEHLAANSTETPFTFIADALDLAEKRKSEIKVHFWSPRLLRDGLRRQNEKLDKAEPDQTWMPPVLRAFLQERKWPCDKQTFAGASVRLAPRSRENIQLVFEPELRTGVLSSKWKEVFPFSPAKNKESDSVGLFWPKTKEDKVPWFDKGEIRCLGVDLGLTNSAAWQILHATDKDKTAIGNRLRHRLNPDSDKPWFARSVANGIVRVAGEDRWVWRTISPDERAKLRAEMKKEAKKSNALCRKFSRLNQGCDLAKATHAFLPELSGSGGRNAATEETNEAEEFFNIFKTKGFDITIRRPNWKTTFSFPEQNDELLWGLKRVRSQLFRLNRWSEQLDNEPNSKPHQAAVEIVGALHGDDPLLELAALTNSPQKLNKRISELAGKYLDCFKVILPKLADRILPWRRGHWAWQPTENGWHKMQIDRSQPRPKASLAGQRGISLARLNQLKDLRQLAQSLNHLCRRKQIEPGEIVPEPFEDCRQAMEDAREDRAKQIAHEIFAIALGVELAPPPADKQERKQTESLHGVYRCLERGPANFIAIENLTDYKTSAKQGRRENRQLTSWSHRRVHKILAELCELVGLPIVLIDPKFTSRFSAKDHSAGFRAEEVRKDDPRRSFWQRKVKEDMGCWQAEFLSWLDKVPEGKSLLLPKKGGEFFVSLGNDTALYQADLNAAYRIALRALSHRDRPELSGQTWIEKKPYLVDTAGVFPDSVLRGGLPFKTIPSSERLWEYVNETLAWKRCREINLARLADWRITLPKEMLSTALPPSDEDDIPM
jgi:IS605 OrfB family transposase